MSGKRSDRGRFDDKVAVITGGSRGVGLATAKILAAEGATVVMVARDATRGARAAREIPGSTFVEADVRLASDCDRAVATAVGTFGRLDVLVNNAGVIYRDKPLDVMAEEEWDHTFDVNVKGVFLMSRSSLASLRQSVGNIVNVASYVGLVGFAGGAAYAASKAAVVNLTRSMALDHAAEGIRVNCVCPGSVDTDMIRAAWNAYGDRQEAERLWASKHPLGRIATPQEVGWAIAFLASDEASFITGAALPVDGGITAA